MRTYLRGELHALDEFNRGYSDMQTNLNRYGPDKYRLLGGVGRAAISATNGLAYVLAPSAVTRTDGPKPMSGLGKRSKTTKTRKGRGLKFRGKKVKFIPFSPSQPTRWMRNLAAKNMPRMTTGMMRAVKRDVADLRLGARPRIRTIRAPVAQGGIYEGTATTIKPKIRRNGKVSLNCSSVKTRIFIGQVGLTAVGGTTWNPSGQSGDDCGGQWFFAPTNQFYFPVGTTIVTLARMYQFFYLKSVHFEFESNIQPGQPTPMRMYYAFIDDPNLGETFIPAYTTVQNVSPGNILKVPMARSEPSWKTLIRLAPPRKWYANNKYTCRSYLINDPIATSTNDIVSQNKQSIPFGLWVNIQGVPASSSTITVCDVFITVDVDFCELAPLQTFTNTGTSILNRKTVEEKKHERKALDVSPTPSLRHADLDDIEDTVVLKAKPLKQKSASAK